MAKTKALSRHSGNGRLAADARQPQIGRVYYVKPADQLQSAWPAPLTPASVKAMLLMASGGWPRLQNDFIDNAMEADPVLSGIYNTRTWAVSGKQWEIIPDPRAENEPLAEEAADYCSDVLGRMDSFESGLSHLIDAIGRSYAVAEIVWMFAGGYHVPSKLVPVHPNSIYGDPMDIGRLRVTLSQSETLGVPIDQFPNKFIAHTPFPVSGNPFRGGMIRRCAVLHLMRRFGFQWWASATELFGTPYRKATYKAGATPEEKTQLEAAMENFGHAGWGIFSEATEFALLDQFKGATEWPHPKLIDAIDKWYAILILGQTLTTSMDDAGGSYAAARVHDHVRRDVMQQDIYSEGCTIRRDLLRPMVQLRFGLEAPIPVFRRVVEDPKDLQQVAQVLDSAVNRLGMTVTKSYAHTELGIPLPEGEDGDEPVSGAKAGIGGEPFGPSPFRLTAATGDPRLVAPTRRTSPVRVLDQWIGYAADRARAQVRAVTETARESLGEPRTKVELAASMGEALRDAPLEDFERAIGDYLVAASLAGALNADAAINRARGRRAAADDPNLDPFVRPFEKSIDALKDRVSLTPDEFLSLDRAARSRAGRIAGEFNMRLVQDIYSEVESQLESGGTVRDFRIALEETPDRHGWLGENPWHANLVFRQNAIMAYQSANLERFDEAEVGHWQFESYDTSCPICEPMIGKTFASSDTEFYPPIHFNCDCWASPIFDPPPDDEVDSGATIDNPAYDESQSDPGAFRYDPRQFAKTEPLDLSTVPALLRDTFRAFAQLKGWLIRG